MKDNITPNAFDISSFRYIEYTKEMGYRDVTSVIKQLKEAISSTVNDWNAGKGVNSIIKLLPDTKDIPTSLISEFILNEGQQIANELNFDSARFVEGSLKRRVSLLRELSVTQYDKIMCDYLESKIARKCMTIIINR